MLSPLSRISPLEEAFIKNIQKNGESKGPETVPCDNHRSKSELSVWPLHLNYLGEVCRFKKNNDVKEEVFNKYVLSILNRLGFRTGRCGNISRKVRAAAAGYNLKNSCYPSRKKSGTNDDICLEELYDFFAKYHLPSTGTIEND